MASQTKYGRPVRVTSICFHNNPPEKILPVVESAAAERPDMIILPETWHDVPEGLDGPTVTALRGIAKKHGVYIVHPLWLMEDGARYNTALLLSRDGEIAGRYDKMYPYWYEFDIIPPSKPGKRPVVWDCDFGKVGAAICFDANFPGMWADMDDMGAEMVVWPSAYAAGEQLKAHALNHHYYIITATSSGHCMVFDLDGRRVVDQQSPGITVNRIALDLDRCIFHENFNLDALDRLTDEYPPRIALERHDTQSQWFIISAAQPDISAREVCRNEGMEELRAYKKRSRVAIDAMRE